MKMTNETMSEKYLVLYNPYTNTIALATDDCWEAFVYIGDF